MSKSLKIGLGVFIAIACCFTLFLFSFIYSLKNAQNCDQFVIDSYELATGIDIPKVVEYDCYYFDSLQTRASVYRIDTSSVNLVDYIQKNNFKPAVIDGQNLWTYNFLSSNQLYLPADTADLFQNVGQGTKANWQTLLDKNTGRLWIEVNWL